MKKRYKAALALLIIFSLTFWNLRVEAWYGTPGWLYRKAITIDHTKIPNTDQTDFPVLIDLTDAGLQANAQSTGNDILFTSVDGTTKLAHQIEIYTSATGRLTAWVKIPTAATAADTVIYMYYGNAAASNQQNATAVWSNNFLGVWHMSDNAATTVVVDSTGGVNGTNAANTSTKTVPGKIGNALTFNGTTDYTLVNSAYSGLTSAVNTFSAWVKIAAYDANGTIQLNTTSVYDIYSADTLVFVNAVAITTPSTSYANNTWFYGSFVSDGSATRFYYNGTQLGSAGGAGTAWGAGAKNFVLNDRASDLGANFTLNGLQDEPRLASVARSADWIKTEYNNQSATSTFYTVGTQENEPSGSSPATTRVVVGPGMQMIIPSGTKMTVQ